MGFLDRLIAPKVSIVVTNFKGTSDLGLSLNALMQTTYPNIEIVVTDICTPNFDEWMSANYPSLKYVHFPDDVGNAGQRNAGLRLIDNQSEYVCFIDDDVIVTAGWLDSIIMLMEECTDIGVVQPMRFNYTVKSEIDGLGVLMTRTAIPHMIERTEKNLMTLKSKKIMDIFYAETTLMIVRHKVLYLLDSESTPLDEDHFFAWDDVDLSWRIWLLGYRVVITSESVCFHNRDVATTRLKHLNARYIYFYAKGKYSSMFKNFDGSWLIKYLPLAITIDVCKCIALLYYKPDHAVATLRGMLWGLIHLRHMMKKRYNARKNAIRKNSDLENVFVHTSPSYLRNQFKYQWK